MVNKKGQVVIMKIMIVIIILISVMIMITPLKEVTTNTMNATNLNCSSTTLSSPQVATCMVVDMSWFYLLGMIISIGMSYLAGSKSAGGAVSAIIIFMLIAILINPLKTFIIYARDATHLNCAVTGSLGNQLLCIFIDAWLFWFILTIASAGITYLFVKKIEGLQ